MTTTSRVTKERFWIVGPACVLLAFFWQPGLRLVQPFVLTSVSSLLVIALFFFDRAANVASRTARRLCLAASIVLALIGVIEAVYFTTRASAVSDANDARCRVLETRMLSSRPDRGADAAVFQALGCRPQSLLPIAPATSDLPAKP